MVKFNEALLVGGSLLVALVLSKGGDFIKNFSMPQNSTNGVVNPIAEPTILPEIQVYQQQKAIVDIGVIIAASNNPKVARDSIKTPPYFYLIFFQFLFLCNMISNIGLFHLHV